mmetsp:Transcript_82712/g.229561  ORF Transcript_82712/g.229561 Transcript_82712/m.229561 type:complete len:216 (-) Transcript_82712:442-1089(-)
MRPRRQQTTTSRHESSTRSSTTSPPIGEILGFQQASCCHRHKRQQSPSSVHGFWTLSAHCCQRVSLQRCAGVRRRARSCFALSRVSRHSRQHRPARCLPCQHRRRRHATPMCWVATTQRASPSGCQLRISGHRRHCQSDRLPHERRTQSQTTVFPTDSHQALERYLRTWWRSGHGSVRRNEFSGSRRPSHAASGGVAKGATVQMLTQKAETLTHR